MPGDPSECREHAKTCLRLAAEARTGEAAEVFEGLARTWLRLATDLENAAAMLAEFREPSADKKK
jgi:hypothetical protein